MKILLTFVAAAIASAYSGCGKDPALGQSTPYKTKNVVIIVVDGPRFTETWGLPSRSLIPYRSQMLREGVFCSSFYNNGYCFTNAGHAAITTGVYQNINNSGLEQPQKPSIFQYWIKASKHPASEAWVIASKDKLAILSDCQDTAWSGKFRPYTDCGTAGLGTGYREDSVTFRNAKNIFTANHPKLALINFKQPDAAAHGADSAGYVQGIIDTDNYVYQFWQFLQSDPFYKGTTALIVTNDHGRHTAGHLDGYISHTDNCEGCKHIEFLALGPDFKQNYTCNVPHEQTDIPATIAAIMGFQMPGSSGKLIKELFR
ncbi:MAG TPA: alkaline phosphatase family protein [Bacteroidia bacterium]